MRRVVPSWLSFILCIAACGPKDRVGQDVLSEEAAGRSAGRAGSGGAGNATPTAGSSEPAAGTSPAGGGAGTGEPRPPLTDGLRGEAGAAGGGAGAGGGGEATAGGGRGAAGAASGVEAGASGGGSGEPVPPDAGCDLEGAWIARLTTFSRDSIFSAVQTASNWFYYELEQTGHEVRVAKALDCGFQISGSADVTINSATVRALLSSNDQTGRKGRFFADADGCALELDRFYSVRGVPRATYLPDDLSQAPALSSIEPPLPTETSPEGAEDWDGDGTLGIAINVAGLGSRHVVQRDWNEFFSDATTTIARSATEFVARANFDSQEQILAVSGGLGALLRAGAAPATGMRHRVLFRRVGASARDASASSIRVEDDLETCYNIQEALPHDPVMQ